MKKGNIDSFNGLINQAFMNHPVPVGMGSGPQGVISFCNDVFTSGHPGIILTIHEQVLEGYMVTTGT
ncbi:hypothetical protein FPZ42_06670 [Mucilaginibacter achroorhodeus]|uniref:Uncharacterized protein n=1 Tax=Mucilaginibacter achroorhodeus TaxID=2599294 RepID=A0A563U5X5_9SPHI|nr:hypothetical protein [Mucilaginibacter achroorhodeus]TWR26714.1 hypothetical protein FPZ42_06670 [Mucilaginibacter achroorhodeus]